MGEELRRVSAPPGLEGLSVLPRGEEAALRVPALGAYHVPRGARCGGLGQSGRGVTGARGGAQPWAFV